MYSRQLPLSDSVELIIQLLSKRRNSDNDVEQSLLSASDHVHRQVAAITPLVLTDRLSGVHSCHLMTATPLMF